MVGRVNRPNTEEQQQQKQENQIENIFDKNKS